VILNRGAHRLLAVLLEPKTFQPNALGSRPQPWRRPRRSPRRRLSIPSVPRSENP